LAAITAGSFVSEPILVPERPAASPAWGASLATGPRLDQPGEAARLDDGESTAVFPPAVPEPRLRRDAERDTIRIDRFGLEDVLDSIAADIGDSFADATPWDDILAEISQ
jgi:hypothetical protein